MEPRSLVILALCVASAQPSDTEALRPLEQVIKSRSDASSAYANEFTKEYEPIAYAAIPLHNPMPVIAILSEKPIQQYAASYKQHSYSKPEHQNDVEIEYQTSTEDDKTFPEFQKLYPKHRKLNSQYQKPHAQYEEYQEQQDEYQKPYPYQKYADFESPYAEYQTQQAEYKPFVEYKKPYVKYQKPHVQYQKPNTEYQRPYVLDYPKYAKYATMEYVKSLPEVTGAYTPVEYIKPYVPIEYRPVYDRVKPYASIEAPTILYARPSESGGYTYHRRPQKKRNVKRPLKDKPIIIRVHKHRVIRSRRSYPGFDYKRKVVHL